MVDRPKPVSSPGRVLVRVVACSINAADYRSMSIGIIPKSKIFGGAITGVVEAVGAGVTGFQVGDAVIGGLADSGFGGFAEFVSAEQDTLTIKPAEVSFNDAATLPVAATTALRAVRDVAKVVEGDDVLIVGASGGVGIFAIQLAKHFGGQVTAVCSTKNVQQSLMLGADRVVDYKVEDVFGSNERYDVIIAVNGEYPLLDYKRALKPNGRYAMVGGSFKQIFSSMLFGWLLSFGSRKMKMVSAAAIPGDLAVVAGLMAKGILRSVVNQVYEFDQIPEAMHEVGKGHTAGKVVIKVGDP